MNTFGLVRQKLCIMCNRVVYIVIYELSFAVMICKITVGLTYVMLVTTGLSNCLIPKDSPTLPCH